MYDETIWSGLTLFSHAENPLYCTRMLLEPSVELPTHFLTSKFISSNTLHNRSHRFLPVFMQVGIHATVIPLGRESSAARSAGTCGVRQYCVTLEKNNNMAAVYCRCHALARVCYKLLLLLRSFDVILL